MGEPSGAKWPSTPRKELRDGTTVPPSVTRDYRLEWRTTLSQDIPCSGPAWRLRRARIFDAVHCAQRRRDHRVFPVQSNSHDLSSSPLERS